MPRGRAALDSGFRRNDDRFFWENVGKNGRFSLICGKLPFGAFAYFKMGFMAKLTIQTIPAEVLRKVAQPVAAVDKNVAAFMEELCETMYKGNGVGLAANQVGSLSRVIAVDVSQERDGTKALLMANPEIIWSEPEELFVYNEGCLSIPGHYADVKRPKRIRMAYTDQHGKRCELEGEDLLSTCIQHEIDHLNGHLFIDHISKLKRDMILRKLEKERREAEGKSS